MIRLDVRKRSIDLLVDAAELEKRQAVLQAGDDARLGEPRLCASVQ